MRDLYSVLNLSRRASSKDIKAAYWALAKQFHPDVNAADMEAEQWIKEINHAYEILGDPDPRAAYDLELARQRAKARRGFWRSAATGAATFLLTAGSISIAVMWKQHASQARNKTEMLVAKAPARERATQSEHLERGADPSEPMSAPLRGPSSALPASTSSEMTSTALTEKAQAPGTPAPSSAVMERAPKEAGPSGAPSEPSKTELREGQPVPQAPPNRQPSPRTELANVVTPEVEAKQPAPTATLHQSSSGEPRTSGASAPSSVVKEQAPKEAGPSAAPSEPSKTELREGQPVPQALPHRQPPPRTELANVETPEVEAKQPAPTAAVDQRSSGEPPRRNGDRQAGAIGSIHKKPNKRLDLATVAATRTPNKLQGSEREPRLVSRGATALRWPSADEPFVNLGVRNR
jgi:curved DNA-binding protein CbpA